MSDLNLSKQSVAALIPAAGQGERLGRGPKAFLPLGEGTLLSTSVTAFSGLVDEIIVAVSEAMLPDIGAHLDSSTGKVTPVLGGTTRQATVYTLLKAARSDLVLIHDAARPFLSKEVIQRTLTAVRETGAASVVRPVADTLVRAETGETVPRDPLRAVQTPQGFRLDLILEAHRTALEHGTTATDDAALVRLLGHEVALVEGSAWLMKITTPTDYALAQALAKSWHAQSGHARA